MVPGSALRRLSIKADVEKGMLPPDALRSPVEMENARIESLKTAKKDAQ